MKVFIRDKSFLISSAGYFKCRIMLSAHRVKSFLICLTSFLMHFVILLSFCLSYDYTYCIELERWEWVYPCFVPDFRGNGLNFSLFSMKLVLDFFKKKCSSLFSGMTHLFLIAPWLLSWTLFQLFKISFLTYWGDYVQKILCIILFAYDKLNFQFQDKIHLVIMNILNIFLNLVL